MKKFLLILISILIFYGFGANLSFAADPTPRDQETCNESMYYKEWRVFLFSFVDFREFKWWWADLFQAQGWGSVCWWLDLESIRDKRDALRQSIRKSFMTCAPQEKLEQQKKLYFKTEAELYFLRQVYKEEDKFKLKNKEILLTDMKKYFTEDMKWLTEEEVESYLNDFLLIYEEAVTKDYAGEQCRDPGFSKLLDKITEFKENLGGLKKVQDRINKRSEQLSKKVDRLKESVKEATSLKDGEGSGIGGFLKNKFGLSVNGIPAKEGLKQIWNYWQGKMGGITFYFINKKSAEEEKRYVRDMIAAEMEAEYTVMYQAAGEEITRAFIEITNETILYIKDTTAQFKDLEKCARTPVEKQCQ